MDIILLGIIVILLLLIYSYQGHLAKYLKKICQLLEREEKRKNTIRAETIKNANQ